MPSITLLADHLQIIPRIGLASDAERASPSLGGVLVRIHPNGDLQIAATDGKILAEWRGNLGGVCSAFPLDPVDLILPWQGSKELRAWFKASMATARRSTRKGEWTITWDDKARNVELAYQGSTFKVRTIEAMYPAYSNTLESAASTPVRVALAGSYLSTVNDILHDGRRDHCATQIRQGRGWVFESMANDVHGYKVLVMPVTIPDTEGDQIVEIRTSRLAELEAREAGIVTGQVATSPDPGLMAENKHLREMMGKRESEIKELKERIALLEATTPTPGPSPLVRWSPPKKAQNKQLEAAGLTVKDLREAGFKWVDHQWMAETEAARIMLEKIKVANGY